MVDNLIRLFEADATQFTTNGIGSLNRAVSCVVVEKRNAEYELELIYPVDNPEEIYSNNDLLDNARKIISDYSGSDITIAAKPVQYEEIKFDRIIVAKPNPYATPQPFRIYSISKPIDGLITINAQHISYDLSGVSVSPFSSSGVVDAFQKIKTHAVGNCPFTFWTDKSSSGSVSSAVPVSMRSILGGSEGSILDVYGGEYEFDKFTVKLHNNRGSNRGVSIRYGKNLTDLVQDENCSNVYTAVYPYYYSESEEGNVLVQLDEKTVKVEGTFDHEKILTLDLTEYFDATPTKEELRYMTQLYINANNIGVPNISLTVSFFPLSETEEYKDYALLEQVNLCDTVNVEFPKLNISATAKCIATQYDVLAGRYISVELGNARSDLTTSFASVSEAINEMPTKSFLEQAIENATNLITGQDGGYVVLNPSNQPQELLVMDRPTIEDATRVWRWNAGGLGYSNNGYNGPYRLAMTMDGAIVADMITTGTLNANLIRAGYLTDRNNSNYWNFDTGYALFTNLRVKERMRLLDSNGFRRASLGWDYADNNASLWIYKEGDTENALATLGIFTPENPSSEYKNSPYLRLRTPNKGVQASVELWGLDSGGRAYIYNRNGNVIARAIPNSHDGGTIAIQNKNGIPVAEMFTTEDNAGYFYTTDASGNQVNYMGENGLYAKFLGKKWARTYAYFDSLAVTRTWGSIYCSVVQKVNYKNLGINTLDNVFISLVTMDSGMWAWPVNTKQDDTYSYFVLARPTRETCQKVKVSLLFIGS